MYSPCFQLEALRRMKKRKGKLDLVLSVVSSAHIILPQEHTSLQTQRSDTLFSLSWLFFFCDGKRLSLQRKARLRCLVFTLLGKMMSAVTSFTAVISKISTSL